MKIIIVRCKCKSCGLIVELENRQLIRFGFKCPKCGHDKYELVI